MPKYIVLLGFSVIFHFSFSGLFKQLPSTQPCLWNSVYFISQLCPCEVSKYQFLYQEFCSYNHHSLPWQMSSPLWLQCHPPCSLSANQNVAIPIAFRGTTTHPAQLLSFLRYQTQVIVVLRHFKTLFFQIMNPTQMKSNCFWYSVGKHYG